MSKNEVSPDPVAAEAMKPSESTAGRMVLGFLVAGMFLIGLVILVVLAAFAYSQGLPMFLIAILAIGLLAGVFSWLRRWANS